MKAEMLLKTHPDGKYYGRIIHSIGETDLSPDELGMKRLKTIPRMLRAHCDTSQIDFVWRSTCFGRGSEYYVIQTPDGTRFIVE